MILLGFILSVMFGCVLGFLGACRLIRLKYFSRQILADLRAVTSWQGYGDNE